MPSWPLQLKSGDPVRVGGDNVSGKENHGLERQMAAMHDRACSD